ncbi:MAG TPA: hypothetical protein VJZ01_10455 [Lachnospiraceae bacterium]|jgi:hypothetical protein|nr:hypothetical protein [Lachnospiraceae bacterium]
MKCRNCGADIPAEALRCAYCDTVNPGGVSFFQRLKAKREANRRLRKELLEKSRETYINKILNRAMIVLGILTVVFVLFSSEVVAYVQGHRPLTAEDAEEMMQQYYDNGEYSRLYHYMSAHDLIGDEYYMYTRVALLNNDYDWFLEARNECLEAIRKQEMPTDEQLRNVIQKGVRALFPEIPAYPGVSEGEQKLTDEVNMTVIDTWRGMFGFREEEITYINENVSYGRLDDEQCAYLIDIAKTYLQEGGEEQ